MPKRGERPRFDKVLRDHGYLSFDQFLLDAEANNWHPAEMARRLGVNHQTLTRWMAEHRCEPRIVYRRIAA